jgi:hypothetical protein
MKRFTRIPKEFDETDRLEYRSKQERRKRKIKKFRRKFEQKVPKNGT